MNVRPGLLDEVAMLVLISLSDVKSYEEQFSLKERLVEVWKFIGGDALCLSREETIMSGNTVDRIERWDGHELRG